MAKARGTIRGGSSSTGGVPKVAEDPIARFVAQQMRRGNQPGPKAGKSINKGKKHLGGRAPEGAMSKQTGRGKGPAGGSKAGPFKGGKGAK